MFSLMTTRTPTQASINALRLGTKANKYSNARFHEDAAMAHEEAAGLHTAAANTDDAGRRAHHQRKAERHAEMAKAHYNAMNRANH